MHSHLLPSGLSTTTRMGMGSIRATAVSSTHRACVQSAFARTECIQDGPIAPLQLASTSYSQDRQLAEACIATLTAALEPDTSTRFWCHQVRVRPGEWTDGNRQLTEVRVAPLTAALEPDVSTQFRRREVNSGRVCGLRHRLGTIWCLRSSCCWGASVLGGSGHVCILPNLTLTSTLFLPFSPQGWGAGRRFYEASIGLALRQQPSARRLIRCRGRKGTLQTVRGEDPLTLSEGFCPCREGIRTPHQGGGVGVTPPSLHTYAAHHPCQALFLPAGFTLLLTLPSLWLCLQTNVATAVTV